LAAGRGCGALEREYPGAGEMVAGAGAQGAVKTGAECEILCYTLIEYFHMDAPKIVSVQALDGKKLLVKFVNGAEKIYDCARLCQLDVFRILDNDAFFNSVRVDAGGYGISWNDEVDLSEYELWTNSVEVVMAE
jgi:hypothetical protein